MECDVCFQEKGDGPFLPITTTINGEDYVADICPECRPRIEPLLTEENGFTPAIIARYR
jgi:hypothetical protein